MKNLLIFCSVAGLAAISLIVLSSNASAESEPSDTVISQNCLQAQATLRSIFEADKVARNNRGNTYYHMTQLMQALSGRAAVNSYSVPRLADATKIYKQLYSQFYEDYKNYGIIMETMTRMDCRSAPRDFYDQLKTVRNLRASIAQRIADMEKQFDAFQAGLNDLKKQMETH